MLTDEGCWLSPNGKKILIKQWDSKDNCKTYILDLSDNSEKEMHFINHYYRPSWSPDNNFIANLDIDSGLIRIYRLDYDTYITLNFRPGRKERFFQPKSLSWSIDGSTLLTSNMTYLYFINICNQKLDSISLDNFYNKYKINAQCSESHFIMSPDNKYIVFDAFKSETINNIDIHDAQAIYRLDLTTDSIERLTPEGLIARDPRFANKNELYFRGTTNYHTDDDIIYKLNLTNKKLTKIVDGISNLGDFSCSYNE